MTERYSAFISYSHSDEKVARWLHRALENYRFPKALQGEETIFGTVPKRLPPVFRDRDELPASGDLGSELRDALAASRFQIVICSPRAAASQWVNEEILSFKRTHGEHRTLALIIEGEPYTGGADECFPPALRFKLEPDGKLSDNPAEPIAADIRKGKDGRRLASLKILAGIAGVKLDALAQRDASRRQRRMAIIAAVSMMIAISTIGLAIYAESQRRVAVVQREIADQSLDFLIGTFEVANPATENPRTITALTILDRASKRAAKEFSSKPEISARLLRATGSIYYNLGLDEESERDLKQALAMEPKRGEGRAVTLLKLADLAKRRSDVEMTERLVDQAEDAYDSSATYAPLLDSMVADQRGNIAYLKADYGAAARLYARAADSYRQLGRNHDEKIILSLTNEAYALVQTKDFVKADKLYAEASNIAVAKFGMNDVRTASVFHNQAFAEVEAGNRNVSLRQIHNTINIYRRVLEKDHPKLADAQFLLARTYAVKGEYSRAISTFDKVINSFADLYGPKNATVGDANFYAAEAEMNNGQFQDALIRTSTVKRIYDDSYGPDDPDQAELLLLQSRIFARWGKLEIARVNCNKALILQRKIKMDAPVLAETQKYCASLENI